MIKKFWISGIFLGLFLCTSQVTGYCGSLSIQDAEYQTQIDGDYNLIEQYSCNYNNLWQNNENYNIYVSYVSNLETVSNGSVSIQAGWVIGFYQSMPCFSNYVYVLAFNPQPSDTEPYDLSNWYELNNNNQYVINSNLQVYCTNDLSGWAIFGIVMGSICGFFLLIAIISCCCSKHKMKKRQRTTAQSAVVFNHGAPNVCVVTTLPAGATTLPGSPQPPVAFVYPPAYDNAQPPTYESIIPVEGVNPVGGVGGEKNGPVGGIANEGYRV